MKYEALNLEKVIISESIVQVPILVTLKDELLDEKSERKTGRLWNTFLKGFGIGTKNEMENVIEVDELFSDDDPFKNKKHVLAMDLEAFNKIEPKDEEKLQIGLRILKDGSDLLMIDHTMQKQNEEKELNHSLEFSEVQEEQEDFIKYLKNLAENRKLEADKEEKIREYEERKEQEKQEEQRFKEKQDDLVEEQQEEKQEEIQDNVDEKLLTVEVEKDDSLSTGEDVISSTKESTSAEQNNQDLEQIVNTDDDDENVDVLKGLKRDLYQHLKWYFPDYSLDNLDVEESAPTLDDKEYKKLYEMTAKGINQHIKRSNNKIESEKQKAINRLYRIMASDLAERFYNIEKLYNYTTDGTEFNNIYLNLNKVKGEALKNVEIQADEQEKVKKQKHEHDKEQYLENVLKKESIKYDEENLPRIQKEIQDYKNTSKQDIDNKHNQQIDQLEDDVYRTVAERIEKLVDDVMKLYKADIDAEIKALNIMMESKIDEISLDNKKEWEKYLQQLKDIEEIRTKEVNSQRSKIDDEVANRTRKLKEEHDTIKNKLENKEEQLLTLQSSLRKSEEANIQKEYSLNSASSERRELIKQIDTKSKRVEDLEKQLEQKNTQIRQLNNSPNFINYPFIKDNRTKKNTSKIKSIYDQFEKLIITVVAAILLGIFILVAASIASGSSNQNDGSSQEVKSLEQKIEKQQKENEAAKSELEQKNSEIENLKKTKEESKKDKDKKAS
ncbi:TPA: hypothetical protein ACK1AU_002613 [Staphylococcus aureus]